MQSVPFVGYDIGTICSNSTLCSMNAVVWVQSAVTRSTASDLSVSERSDAPIHAVSERSDALTSQCFCRS